MRALKDSADRRALLADSLIRPTRRSFAVRVRTPLREGSVGGRADGSRLEARPIRAGLRIGMLAAVIFVGSALPASATHTHVRMTGNGACVVLAPNGGERHVQLPHAEEFAENRRHPLHVNVHLGEPGRRHGEPVVWVAGSAGAMANCDGYVND